MSCYRQSRAILDKNTLKAKCPTTTGCPCKKSNTFGFSKVYDQFRLIETFNLEVEPVENIRTVQFDIYI